MEKRIVCSSVLDSAAILKRAQADMFNDIRDYIRIYDRKTSPEKLLCVSNKGLNRAILHLPPTLPLTRKPVKDDK